LIRALLVYASSDANRTLSYQRGWPRHFQQHLDFSCTVLNVADRRSVWGLRARFLGRQPFDAVVLLHSVFSNEQQLSSGLRRHIRSLNLPTAFFIGNEYKLMPEKMTFCEELGVDLLVSQFTAEASLELYRKRLQCKVIGIPNTGLDTELFAPVLPRRERPIDLGYRAFDSPLYLGHAERIELASYVADAAARYGLQVDISLDPSRRFDERGWAGFLNQCKGQLGSEAGGDYFELDDRTRLDVNTYVTANPEATLEEIRARFFDRYENPVPGRALSGRIVEAAGTKTTQLLLEGEYGGFFEPDVHYIAVKKDYSDIEAALEKFSDVTFADGVAERAFELARHELTYGRLIDRFSEAFGPLVASQ
jgi:hypothetical protein